MEQSKEELSAAEPAVDKPSLHESASETLSLASDSHVSEAMTDEASAVKAEIPEVEWIPGEELELIRIPPPTIWPATLALGTTGIAFGVVTHWILSLAGLFLFLLGAAGWIEDMRKDVLQ